MRTVKVLVFHPERCKGERACERACSKVQYFRSDEGGEKSALRITEGEDGKFECKVCDQCGLCVDLCPVLALRRLKSGVVALNKAACVGCQSCVAFCEVGAMQKAPGHIVPFKCFSCGKCVEACPNDALELVEMPIEELEREVYARHGRVCP